MKTKHICILTVLILLFGCASIEYGTVETVGVRILARELGKSLADQYPQVVEPARIFAQGLQEGVITIDALQIAEQFLKDNIDDPYLIEDLKDIYVKIIIDKQIDEPLAQEAIKGFLQGLVAK